MGRCCEIKYGESSIGTNGGPISGPVVKDELAFRLSVDHQQRETAVDLPHYDPVGNPRWFKSHQYPRQITVDAVCVARSL